MRVLRSLLWLVARIVPVAARQRWLEEWRAELAHGRWMMALGAPADAWAVRNLAGPGRPTLRGKLKSAVQGLPQDLRHGSRGLLKMPGFVLGVVLSLALGIGANVLAFSFVNVAVFRPFAGVERQDELVRVKVQETDRQGFTPFVPYSDLDLETARQALTTLTALSAHEQRRMAVLARGQASAVLGGLVSSNYFEVLGVRPAQGRFFAGNEDDVPWAHAVAVISHAAWERLFARDPSVIDQTIVVNGAALQIIGVTPQGFTGVTRNNPGEGTDVWIPLGLAELTIRDGQGRPAGLRSGRAYFDYVGRRNAGTTIEQVQAEASVLARRLDPEGKRKIFATATRVQLNDLATAAPEIALFMVIPFLVLAIACVNAANLLLARSARQRRDWAVRMAIGASRWRIIRQVLTEATLLAAGAAVVGVLFAKWAAGVVTSYVPVALPMDGRVGFFTIVLSLLTAIAFSLGPAVGVTSAASRRIVSGAASGGGSRSRVRFGLVAIQAALSLGLLTTGVQFTRTVFAANPNAASIPDPRTLVLATFDVDPIRLAPAAGDEFYRRLVERIKQVPGVASAGLSTTGLVTGAFGGSGARVWVPGSPAGGDRVIRISVTPDALRTIGVPLLQGRHFAEADALRPSTVIVNRPFAKKYLQGVAIGATFRLGSTAKAPGSSDEVTVIGIVDGIMKRADNEPAVIYQAASAGYEPERALYIRADDTGIFSAAALHAAVRDVDPRVPVGQITTLQEHHDERGLEYKLVARVAACLGLVALLLAAGGLYSVVSYVVSLRRQEVGIRLALGADRRSIVHMIVRQALTPTLVGAAVGAGGAAVAGVIIRSQLHGTSPVDPLVFAAAGVMMVVVMTVASWIPARQAGQVDPLQVLRGD